MNASIPDSLVPPRRRASRAVLVLGSLAMLLILVVIVAVSVGPVRIPFLDTIVILLDQVSPESSGGSRHELVVETIRLPRVLVALLVGMALAVAGTIMQALFRNPLADPGVTGVSSGAAAGSVLVLAGGATAAGRWVLPAAAFTGALAALILVHMVAAVRRDRSAATLLLIGIALNALLGAVISAVIANVPDDRDVRGIVFWLNGDLVARTWEHVGMAVLPVALGVAASLVFTRDLNMLLLGEGAAQAAGVDVVRTRRVLLTLAAVITGASVAVAGAIGFVGLVVPHLVRLAIGPDHRLLLPASALLGGSFLVLADLGARMLFSPVILQTGTVTALIGAPVFLLLVLRRKRKATP
ncbi:ABC-type Fe3+-siderophore transport system, permease component [Actinoalloteichus sp. GBA129-24]|uniref:ABC-type Fe3+-siderophore transport system, permease component n=1 Tax=Actinoalloteichus fjordicus TaxID=1612552 RepID=A0AAC9LFH9_9PSEU|nr:ABC-type Fe3+-siderophore transport system, permease component [Actinoalloteichus fjordicus]APU21437.1 ABC-type Fe3+-siderophore transport system, permease component [Actinoalloteichus sp. GBA129-24]